MVWRAGSGVAWRAGSGVRGAGERTSLPTFLQTRFGQASCDVNIKKARKCGKKEMGSGEKDSKEMGSGEKDSFSPDPISFFPHF